MVACIGEWKRFFNVGHDTIRASVGAYVNPRRKGCRGSATPGGLTALKGIIG